MGGMAPLGMTVTEDDEPRECLDFKSAEEWWSSYLVDAKKEAAYAEETREMAMKGIVYTNQKELSCLNSQQKEKSKHEI